MYTHTHTHRYSRTQACVHNRIFLQNKEHKHLCTHTHTHTHTRIHTQASMHKSLRAPESITVSSRVCLRHAPSLSLPRVSPSQSAAPSRQTESAARTNSPCPRYPAPQMSVSCPWLICKDHETRLPGVLPATCVYMCMYVCMYVYEMYIHTSTKSPGLVYQGHFLQRETYVCMYVCMYVCIDGSDAKNMRLVH